MKNTTKAIIAVLVALLALVISVSIFMANQSAGSDFDPILDNNLANAADKTPDPEQTATPTPSASADSDDGVNETVIEVSQSTISGNAGKASTVLVTVTPEKYADYVVSTDDSSVISVSRTDEGFDYRLEGEGRTTVTIEASNGKKRTITAVVSAAPTQSSTGTGSTYASHTPVPTVAPTPVPTVAPTAVPETVNPENPAWSEGDLNNYDPTVDAGNVNACEYELNGQTYTSDENAVPAGANILRCWPK